MSHLGVYLDQISVSCQGIRSLPFPPPKVFTNALLYNDDITSLIRDTEAHERALFSVPPPPPAAKAVQPEPASASNPDSTASSTRRRQTVFNVAAGEVTTGPPTVRPSAAPRRQTAVAAVLGGDLHAQIGRRAAKNGGDVDVNILLKGAEKLCSVYALPGALERIPVLRQKHAQQTNTLTYYENKVAEQAQRLEEMNRGRRGGGDGDDEDDDVSTMAAAAAQPEGPSEEELRHEENEIRELERKKKELQERLRAMDKDLGGLLNM
ncbi:hypothetical protein SEUCBS139899_004566 [Sporothrix eucalyptigena]|uniref:DASH complex subunit SPC34 n=1 Tax=Sporothrix eucalyptigena TaxID=1812306 RepID=A0ABP0CX83_9PEZI